MMIDWNSLGNRYGCTIKVTDRSSHWSTDAEMNRNTCDKRRESAERHDIHSVSYEHWTQYYYYYKLASYLLFFVLDKKCNEEEKISTGACYKTTQRKWMKSGTGSQHQDMPFHVNFITYRASRSISNNAIYFFCFITKMKKNKFVLCALWKFVQGIETQFESLLA